MIEQLGGKPAPAVGFGLGVERVLLLLADEQQRAAKASVTIDAYVVHAGDAATPFAWQTAELLTEPGLRITMHAGGGNFKTQMKKADASNARFALIIGDDEAAAQEVSVKPLRAAAEQRRLKLSELAGALRATN